MTPRPATTDELRFVRSSWVQSYATSDFAMWLSPPELRVQRKASHEYWETQKRIIESLLARAETLVIDDGGLIAAWACLESQRGIVHYVYTRLQTQHRKQGLARLLLGKLRERTDVQYTHRSRDLESKRLPRGWRFAPHELWPAVTGDAA